MEAAVSAVISSKMGCKKAAKKFVVPQTTFEQYAKKKRENPGGSISKKMGCLK
jgi:hypothetical protein